MVRTRPRRVAAVVTAATLALGACGADDTAGPDLTPAAADGRSVMRSKGCGSCHGSNGGGGVGPAFTGLFGADVPLDDGSTVVADRDYLVESILDPSAKRVEGYSLPMPRTELTDDEIDAIITYIEALATPTTTGVDG